MATPLQSKLYERFSQFVEHPTRAEFEALLLENHGEFGHLDFKAEWIFGSKLARHVLAMANSGGGMMVVGVKENDDKTLTADGLASLEDKASISAGIKKFVPHSLDALVLDFAFTERDEGAAKGKKFQVLLVHSSAEHLPYVCLAQGDEIKDGVVYVREGTESVPASHPRMQELINRRIEALETSPILISLQEHCSELKYLYSEIPQYFYESSITELMLSIAGTNLLSNRRRTPNPAYPIESYDQFVSRAIDAKKAVIIDVLKRR
jgi:hypothetical protein